MEVTEKYFSVIVNENIRSFVAELNSRGLTKDDIVGSPFFNPSTGSYYALVYN